MNKLLTIAASLVLGLIAGLNATLLAKAQSPSLKIQLGSGELQPTPEIEQSPTLNPTLSSCLACGMG